MKSGYCRARSSPDIPSCSPDFAGTQPETLGIGDTLRDEEILPGFSLVLSELFQS